MVQSARLASSPRTPVDGCRLCPLVRNAAPLFENRDAHSGDCPGSRARLCDIAGSAPDSHPDTEHDRGAQPYTRAASGFVSRRGSGDSERQRHQVAASGPARAAAWTLFPRHPSFGFAIPERKLKARAGAAPLARAPTESGPSRSQALVGGGRPRATKPGGGFGVNHSSDSAGTEIWRSA